MVNCGVMKKIQHDCLVNNCGQTNESANNFCDQIYLLSVAISLELLVRSY